MASAGAARPPGPACLPTDRFGPGGGAGFRDGAGARRTTGVHGMIGFLARLAMAMAVASLGESRREWGIAMEAEMEAARADDRQLSFALGCLLAAWAELPRREEGRFLIASYLLAFALPIPTAALLAASIWTDFPVSYLREVDAFGLVGLVGGRDPLLNEANRSAIPALAIVLSAVAATQLRMAWLVLERDWARIATLGTLLAAATLTLLIFSAIVFASYGLPLLQAAALTIELVLVSRLGRWDVLSFGGQRKPRAEAAHER